MTSEIQTNYQANLESLKTLNNGTFIGTLNYALVSGVYVLSSALVYPFRKGIENILNPNQEAQ